MESACRKQGESARAKLDGDKVDDTDGERELLTRFGRGDECNEIMGKKRHWTNLTVTDKIARFDSRREKSR